MPNQPPLTPIRHQPSFFSLDISSIGLKDQVQSMEHPIFSLSKKPDMQTRHYADRHGNTLTVTPSGLGLPTIWDKDILVYAISTIIAARKRGEEAGPTIRFHIADVIEFGQMTKCGPTYRRLDNAIRRLVGCTLETNIRTGGIETTTFFHIIDEATIKRRYNRIDGRLEYVEFTLSDWLWRAIEAREILTLHPDYFRLRQALARRLYEIARKYCGRKPEWQIGLELLHEKSGSKMSLRQFRHTIRKLAATGDLLDYDMDLEAGRSAEIVRFRLRKDSGLAKTKDPGKAELSDQTLRQAAEIIGEAGSVGAAVKEHQSWVKEKRIAVRNPPAHFLKFCKSWREQAGPPASADARPRFRDPFALAWWRGLTEAERGAQAQAIGIRTEIGDHEYIRNETALARRAFEDRYPPQFDDPAAVEFPTSLLEKLKEQLPPDITVTALVASWKECVQTDRSMLNIDDPLLSLHLFANDVVQDKPAAMRAVKAAAESERIRQQQAKSAEDASRYIREIATWTNRAEAWWQALTDAERAVATASHGPNPDLIRFLVENFIMHVDAGEMTAARAYAVTHPPPQFQGHGLTAVKANRFRESLLSDEGFCRFHDIEYDEMGWSA